MLQYLLIKHVKLLPYTKDLSKVMRVQDQLGTPSAKKKGSSQKIMVKKSA